MVNKLLKSFRWVLLVTQTYASIYWWYFLKALYSFHSWDFIHLDKVKNYVRFKNIKIHETHILHSKHSIYPQSRTIRVAEVWFIRLPLLYNAAMRCQRVGFLKITWQLGPGHIGLYFPNKSMVLNKFSISSQMKHLLALIFYFQEISVLQRVKNGLSGQNVWMNNFINGCKCFVQ